MVFSSQVAGDWLLKLHSIFDSSRGSDRDDTHPSADDQKPCATAMLLTVCPHTDVDSCDFSTGLRPQIAAATGYFQPIQIA
jgi:hypothetical protein